MAKHSIKILLAQIGLSGILIVGVGAFNERLGVALALAVWIAGTAAFALR